MMFIRCQDTSINLEKVSSYTREGRQLTFYYGGRKGTSELPSVIDRWLFSTEEAAIHAMREIGRFVQEREIVS